MTDAVIYTDGSCHGNPGPGGYCAVALCDGKRYEVSGGDYDTTSNRMELTAVIEGLALLPVCRCSVKIITDSKYVADAINRGVTEYLHAGSKANADLWRRVEGYTSHTLRATWIRGHAGNQMNEYCDSRANDEARRVIAEAGVRERVFRALLLNEESVNDEYISDQYCVPIGLVQKYRSMYNSRYCD